MTTLDLTIGDIYEFEEGRHRFHEEWDDGTLWFVKEKTGRRLPLVEDELIEKLDTGRARRIDVLRGRDGKPQPCNANAEFGPDEEGSDDDIRAKTFQYLTRQWDEAPNAKLGKHWLGKFILAHKRTMPRGLTWNVQPARLYDAITKCGEPGNRPLKAFRSRRGRTQRERFPRFVEDKILETIRFFWAVRARMPDDAYAYFRAQIAEENARRRTKDLAEITKLPHQVTIWRRINKTINRDNWALKYGLHQATLKFAGITDSPTAEWPLELVIMDHTTADSWVVLDTETGLPLRRPTLTIAICTATRIVLGYVISFEGASLYAVMATLKRVVRSKSYVPFVFPDIDYVPDAWDGWGLPEALLVDSAWEFKSPSFQDSLRDVGIEPIWSPVRRPAYKAIGERFLDTLNKKLFHKIPGAVPFGPTKMRLAGLDPRKEARITLGLLDELIHETISEYHLDEHSSLGEAPASAWKRKLKTRRTISDVHSLDALLAQTATVRLTRKGIKFRGQTFHDASTVSRVLGPMSATAKRRDQSHSPVGSARCWAKIRFDLMDASVVGVWNDAAKPARYESLPNRDRKFVYGTKIDGAQRDPSRELRKPISFWHAEQVREFAKENSIKFRTDEEKWVAKNRLRAKWEKAGGIVDLPERKNAIRGLAQSQMPFDRLVKAPPGAVAASQVAFATAPSTPSGMDRATLVPQQVAAFEREQDEYFQPKGRGSGKKGQMKAARTREEKAEAAAEERAERAVEDVKRRAKKAAAKDAAAKTPQPTAPPEAPLSRADIDKYLDDEV